MVMNGSRGSGPQSSLMVHIRSRAEDKERSSESARGPRQEEHDHMGIMGSDKALQQGLRPSGMKELWSEVLDQLWRLQQRVRERPYQWQHEVRLGRDLSSFGLKNTPVLSKADPHRQRDYPVTHHQFHMV